MKWPLLAPTHRPGYPSSDTNRSPQEGTLWGQTQGHTSHFLVSSEPPCPPPHTPCLSLPKLVPVRIHKAYGIVQSFSTVGQVLPVITKSI